MSHTKGKWEVHIHNHVDGEFWCSIGVQSFGPITDIIGEEGNKAEFWQPVAGMKYLVTPVEEQKANAERIVQCVNKYDTLQASHEKLIGVIEGTLRIEDLWLIKEPVNEQHVGEAEALSRMKVELEQALAEAEKIRKE